MLVLVAPLPVYLGFTENGIEASYTEGYVRNDQLIKKAEYIAAS